MTGILTTPLSLRYYNLSSTPTTIIETSTNVIQVVGIDICNKGKQNIRINLQYISSDDSNPTYKFKNFQVKSFNNLEKGESNSVDLITKAQTEYTLQYTTSPPLTNSLVCFSNGYTQKFDCTVYYYTLNELPT
jgi:hypothetical protein